MKHSVVLYGLLTVSATSWLIGYIFKMDKDRRQREIQPANDMWLAFHETHNRQHSEELLLKAAQDEYKLDANKLKNWAWALIKWAGESESELWCRLREVQPKLEQALETNPHDLEAKFLLGMVINRILQNDVAFETLGLTVYFELYHTAIYHLEEVRNKEPGLYKDSKLRGLKSCLPSDVANLKSSEMNDVEDDDIEDDEDDDIEDDEDDDIEDDEDDDIEDGDMAEDTMKIFIIKQNYEAAGKHDEIINDVQATLILEAISRSI